MSYIELRNITKKYKNKTVLDGFDLSVEQGEMVAIMGRTGCGKSTLLHIMSGIETMDSGKYILDGEDLSRAGKAAMAKLRNEKIGYILQSYALIPAMTAYENIILPLQMRKIIGNETYFIIEKIASRLEITELLEQRVRDLSGGEKQRVAIARALVIRPKVILADEPTGALDEESATELMQLLCELKQDGNTLIIVTHSPKVAGFADRVVQI